MANERLESPDLILLSKNVSKESKAAKILDLCSSSDDEQNDNEYDNHNINVAELPRKRTYNVSNKQDLPVHKRRKLNIHNHKSIENSHETDCKSNNINKTENEQKQKTDLTKRSKCKFRITQSEIRSRIHPNKGSYRKASSCMSRFTECIRYKDGIEGNIQGTSQDREYHVSIHKDKSGHVHGKCTCAQRAKNPGDNDWCKHIVALGFTYIKNSKVFTYQSVVV